MWGSRLRRAAVVLAVLAGSQLGHAIVYSARYGLAAGSAQATGAHAYFPAVAGALSAVLGVALLACLLVLAAARSVRPGPAVYRLRATARFLDVLPLLFAAQLLLFMGQETVEGLFAGGGHLASVVELLFWGALGQLPAAALAAGVLTWLLARLEAAWPALLAGVARLLDEFTTAALERAVRPEPVPAFRLASAFPSAFRKRGPPLRSNR